MPRPLWPGLITKGGSDLSNEKSLPKVKDITVSTFEGGKQQDKTLTVIKMPLGRYTQFFTELEKIPETIKVITKMFFGEGADKEGFAEAAKERGDEEGAEKIEAADEVTNEQMIEAIFQLPSILTKHWGDLVELLAIASGLPKDDIEQLDLDEATTVVMAVVEVNNFFGIGNRYKELLFRKEAQRMTVPQKKKNKK